MRKTEKRQFLRNISFASAGIMFISLLSLIVVGQPVVTGRSVSVSVSAINFAENPLPVITSILIAMVIVTAVLFLGSKLMESRL